MKWDKKVAFWASFLVLLGLAYLCTEGATYLDEKTQPALSKWSSRQCSFDCTFIGRSFDAIPSAVLPEFEKSAGPVQTLPDYTDTEVKLTKIEVQTPSFLQSQIDKVEVSGFSGLAPPRLTIRGNFLPHDQEPVQAGTWTLRLLAFAELQSSYWEKQLQFARTETAELKSTNAIPDKIERASKRLTDLERKASLMSLPLPLDGVATITIKSTSKTLALGARGLSVVVSILSLVLYVLSFIFGGLGVLLGYLYINKLEDESDRIGGV